MAAPKKAPATKKKAPARKKKGVAEPASRGLDAPSLAADGAPAEVSGLARQIVADGGSTLAVYRDPVGGHFQILAGLPIDKVEPTPFQRDLSKTHVERLGKVIAELDRYLDPVVTIRTAEGRYWTPNGHHRLAAVRQLGGKSILAIVIPDAQVMYRILAMNTEKAHNLKEKALEVIRMARSLAEIGAQPESSYAIEFEDPALLTLGCAYERSGRFAGSSYHPILKRVESFFDRPLKETVPLREERAARLLDVDAAVDAAVKALKARGFENPYLKAFVVARINPVRHPKAKGEFDEVVDKMLERAKKFDASSINKSDVTGGGGPPEE